MPFLAGQAIFADEANPSVPAERDDSADRDVGIRPFLFPPVHPDETRADHVGHFGAGYTEAPGRYFIEPQGCDGHADRLEFARFCGHIGQRNRRYFHGLSADALELASDKVRYIGHDRNEGRMLPDQNVAQKFPANSQGQKASQVIPVIRRFRTCGGLQPERGQRIG